MTNSVLYYQGSWLLDQSLHQSQGEFNQRLLNFVCAHQTAWFTSIESGYDRTLTSSHYPINLRCDILPSVAGDHTLSEIFHDRAIELWNLGKPLSFMWSGGIDSTSALVALINTNPDWYRDIEVITTPFCLSNEYPKFFQDFLEKRDCVTVLEGSTFFTNEFWSKRHCIVTGDCADQLFGFGFVRRLSGDFLTDQSIRDVGIDQIRGMAFDLVQSKYNYLKQRRGAQPCLDLFHNLPESRDIFMSWFNDFIQRSPVVIRDGFDFQWWTAFSMKLQTLRYRSRCLTSNSAQADINRHLAFFDCGGFQRWAIDHHNEKWPGRLKHTYKQPFKDFIYNTTGDIQYLETKGKESSWAKSLPPGMTPSSCVKYLDSTNFIMLHGPDWLPDSHFQTIVH